MPRGESLQALRPLLPVFLSYVLSFVYVGIYWNNHHYMSHTTSRVTGPSLWASLHLLFWLPLFPFATGWMGENRFAPAAAALYSVVLLMAAVAYWVLQRVIIASAGPASVRKKAVGSDWKANFLHFFTWLLWPPLSGLHGLRKQSMSLLVRPAGRTHLGVKVPYTPGKGKC